MLTDAHSTFHLLSREAEPTSRSLLMEPLAPQPDLNESNAVHILLPLLSVPYPNTASACPPTSAALSALRVP